MAEEILHELENKIGYVFKNQRLLQEAMTHSSYANERKINKLKCNERLEFLGDAVLELVSSDYLFNKFPDKSEGELSKLRAALVCETALYGCSHDISLEKYVFLGKGEDAGGGRKKPSLISDAFEALIGAVYLDGGFENAREMILQFILADKWVEKASETDSKSKLQEILQKNMKNVDIRYEVLGMSGPEHSKEFEVAVFINGEKMGVGSGTNKKSAEKKAAAQAIIKLNEIK